MDKIKLFWWKLEKGHGNFGDELNPYIISKLSGQEVEHIDLPNLHNNTYRLFKTVGSRLIRGKYKISNIFRLVEWKYFFKRKINVIAAIGSVLSHFNYRKALVWGSGIMSINDVIHPASFYAVRGHYTRKRIQELGMVAPEVIGDPALLLPILYRPTVTNKKYKIAVIPHYVHFNKINNVNKDKDIIIINLTDDIEKVIDEINSSHLTVSTSLHGLIVSHAYGIPSLWITINECKDVKLAGDDTKFKDYFSSVAIKEYTSWDGKTFSDWEANKIYDTITNTYEDVLQPDSDVIVEIQKNLIHAAPFFVKKQLKELFS